jgi:predicted DNA-binding transcriptional regulator YafY
MKAGSRPQYYRIRRMIQMIREGMASGKLVNKDFMTEFGVSRRTVARDLDFLRDEERAPLAYEDARHGFRLTDETYALPPVSISRREAFSFALARKLLTHYEGDAAAPGYAVGAGQNRRVARGRHHDRAGLVKRACGRFNNSCTSL